MMTLLHQRAQKEILAACEAIGIPAQLEYRGKGYRSDVMAFNGSKKTAFEIQITRQTLGQTQKRQEKFINDGVTGCWLFEKEPSKQHEELEQLPIFQLIYDLNGLFVSLKGRKKLPISTFVQDFLNDKIKFCRTLNPIPIITVKFVEMKCWKCGTINHIYYLAPFHSACNTEIIRHDEQMWADAKFSMHPKIVQRIKEYTHTEEGKKINLATIKQRFSRTIGASYKSFGCSKCDSIFGDWFVHEAMIDTWYGEGIADTYSFPVDFDLNMRQNIPHWCHPGEHNFCEC